MEPMIPTNKGAMTPSQIVDELTYSAYKHNRDTGMEAEKAHKWGFGNAAMEERYQLEKQSTNNLNPGMEKKLLSIVESNSLIALFMGWTKEGNRFVKRQYYGEDNQSVREASIKA